MKEEVICDYLTLKRLTGNYSVLHGGLSPSKTKIIFSSLRYRFT